MLLFRPKFYVRLLVMELEFGWVVVCLPIFMSNKPVAETTANEGNKKCEKCKKVCESLLLCTVRFFSYFNVLFQLGKKISSSHQLETGLNSIDSYPVRKNYF